MDPESLPAQMKNKVALLSRSANMLSSKDFKGKLLYKKTDQSSATPTSPSEAGLKLKIVKAVVQAHKSKALVAPHSTAVSILKVETFGKPFSHKTGRKARILLPLLRGHCKAAATQGA